MRRFSACRLPCYFFFIFVVVVVQISLNLLLSYCGDNRRFRRDDRTGITTIPVSFTTTKDQRFTQRLRATEQSLFLLKRELKHKEETRENTTKRLKKENEELSSLLAKYVKLDKIVSAQEFSKIKTEISKSDFLKGDTVNSELSVVPFDSFTGNGIYSVNKDGLVDRPARRPLGTRYKEHSELLKFSLRVLNDDLPSHQKRTLADLVTGITRLDRLNGMQYNLFFTASKPNQYHRVKIRRPFSNLEPVDNIETVDTSKEPINLILPLSGRTEKLKVFLKRFADICVRWDARVFLTVVYFGQKERDRLQSIFYQFEKKENFKDYKIIFQKGPFSRGAGLQKGVLSWEKGNNIMFFCDVDMYFTASFLERCRLYTEPGKMVYYPIVYSLYNPEVVYNGAPPSIEQQLYVGKQNGYWRDFGFGMTCQYKNDFILTKGFDTSIHGWGIEDVKLYRKFLKTDLAVIRATDYGIFHMYHPKFCDPILPGEQYMACLKSKAMSEGSHRQMGMLAFGTNLFSNVEPDWKTKLIYKPNFSKRNSKIKSEEARNLWKKADELDIETLEIKLLRKRLEAAVNFTVLGENILQSEKFKVNTTVLKELQYSVKRRALEVKQLAQLVEKKHETQKVNITNTTSKKVV